MAESSDAMSALMTALDLVAKVPEDQRSTLLLAAGSVVLRDLAHLQEERAVLALTTMRELSEEYLDRME